MRKIFISFCQGSDTIVERIITKNLKSRFIHVEIIANEFVYDYSEYQGKKGKKKWMLRDRLNSESYRSNKSEIFEIPFPEEEFFEVYKFIEDYYESHDYDRDMKVYRIFDLGFGNKDFIKGNLSEAVTICSHFCFEVIGFIVKRYHTGNEVLGTKIERIWKHYRDRTEYITPGHLYSVFKDTEIFKG